MYEASALQLGLTGHPSSQQIEKERKQGGTEMMQPALECCNDSKGA
jgi:hypothetical protein